jgi:hypothetical protein
MTYRTLTKVTTTYYQWHPLPWCNQLRTANSSTSTPTPNPKEKTR